MAFPALVRFIQKFCSSLARARAASRPHWSTTSPRAWWAYNWGVEGGQTKKHSGAGIYGGPPDIVITRWKNTS